MLEIGYGHTITSIDDAHIRLVDSALAGIFCAGNPGSMLVDFLPLCECLCACGDVHVRFIHCSPLALCSEIHPSMGPWDGMEEDRGAFATWYRHDEFEAIQRVYASHGMHFHLTVYRDWMINYNPE